MIGYLLLSLGGLLFAAMVYRYDMHEPEPWWMLLSAVAAGALAMWGAFALEGVFESLLIDSGPKLRYEPTKAVLAGTIEELGKLAIPILIVLLIRKHFNDPMDGLIYGSMAGLGAALFESAWWQFYVHAHTDTELLTTHGQTAVRLLMHTIWGGTTAYALGFIVIQQPWRAALAKSLGGVVLLHIAWDYLIGFNEKQTVLVRFLAAVFVAISVVWYGLLVAKTNKLSRERHAPKSKQRLAGKLLRAIALRLFR